MKCPRCDGVDLTNETTANISYDRCPSCRGLWLDERELEQLVEARPRQLIQEDRHFTTNDTGEGPRLNCPRCKGTAYLIKLNSRMRPGTIIDSCKVCFGVWLDAGEFSRLAHPALLSRLRALLGFGR